MVAMVGNCTVGDRRQSSRVNDASIEKGKGSTSVPVRSQFGHGAVEDRGGAIQDDAQQRDRNKETQRCHEGDHGTPGEDRQQEGSDGGKRRLSEIAREIIDAQCAPCSRGVGVRDEEPAARPPL